MTAASFASSGVSDEGLQLRLCRPADGIQQALAELRDSGGRLDEDPSLVVSFNERQRLVNKALFDHLDQEYMAGEA
ncbi:hypothetical protein [Cupriavidus basilensis]|uniref:Uncharacterized protein n=1 Tax=Cupriavidus basilensis TaxID=68895 RepID=A0A0C4Y905_9BURK|nr:hypothetical protein RR42_m2046 [Cupriavidus basilensis]